MKIEIGKKAIFEKTISEYDVYAFAGITGDFNPVHINSKYVSKTIFKNRIVHGTLLLGFIGTVLGTKLPGERTILRKIEAEYLKPIFFGETITAVVEVIEIKENIITLKFNILKENNQIAVQGKTITSVPKSEL